MYTLSIQTKHLLIANEQCRSIQVVGPECQQLILSEVHQFLSGGDTIYTYMFTYEASVTTCAGIGVCHNQHIRGFYEGTGK